MLREEGVSLLVGVPIRRSISQRVIPLRSALLLGKLFRTNYSERKVS